MPSQVKEVLTHAGEVRLALLSPLEAGDFAAEILKLNAAIDRLREVKSRIESAPPGSEERAVLESDLRELRGNLERLRRLAGHGEAFWRGWGRMLGLDTGGYRGDGLPADLSVGQAATRVLA